MPNRLSWLGIDRLQGLELGGLSEAFTYLTKIGFLWTPQTPYDLYAPADNST
jgi:hypothetical protein